MRAIKPPLGTYKEAENIPTEVPTDTSSDMDTETYTDVPIDNGNAKMEESTIEASIESPEQEGDSPNITIITTPEGKEDDSDGEAVGKEEAAALDRDMMTDENTNDTTSSEEPAGGKVVSTMFQRLLNMNVAAGQAMLGTAESNNAPTPANTPFRASLEQNGRMICNLPDHPIHAGATAIVAVLTTATKTLTVANAGDSRAVLCRNGTTVPLSFDHKPMQATELSRINKAGGFVNNFGRVNGNLNLSRSIGDLKYKQVPGIPPPEQMITAEPDIIQYVFLLLVVVVFISLGALLSHSNSIDYSLCRFPQDSIEFYR